ncbi:MAG: bifunctional UDP-N-acetylglucosamine diphosphorylase/glucosamine-1-phosphate N-acetyltransferase GlmU, partial [Halieaceae bacterium]|nr:bifunctional UDP-N-acetylglucosamine diphosphorylase/glucosamine-1-phosphate N-acetyltransferase GlmU [Halieaceae bacterium]
MLEVIVLAAGRGTRMHSDLPKVLHPLAGKPMVAHVIDTARDLGADRIHVVVGHGAELVRGAVAADDVAFHEQAEQLGTGHAVQQALPYCSPESVALVLFGDVPLLAASTLAPMLEVAREQPVLLATTLDDPTGYGRVLRDAAGHFSEVVEHKDATPEQRAVREVNTGVLAATAAQLTDWLSQVTNDNAQGEYYLPDVLTIAREAGLSVAVQLAADASQTAGVNDRLQLEQLERTRQKQRAEALLSQGVALADRQRIDIRGELICGRDVFIDVNVVVEGRVVLGDGVKVSANCVLRDSELGAGTEVEPFSYIDGATVGARCRIGPYARLRPGSALDDAARIGNFVETKNSRIGAGSKANHLAYIGDADVGAGSNIGAGTITCNYDGVNKHRTVLGDDVFVGSNSTLVAPVTIESGGFVGAGST